MEPEQEGCVPRRFPALRRTGACLAAFVLALPGSSSARGAELRVTEGTVRARIKQTEEEKPMRMTGATDIDRFRDAALSYVSVGMERCELSVARIVR